MLLIWTAKGQGKKSVFPSFKAGGKRVVFHWKPLLKINSLAV